VYSFEKEELAIKASIMYYEKNKSQNEIAKELKISRSYVSQLLAYARENNIVDISINIDEFNLRMLRMEIEFGTNFPGVVFYIMKSDSNEFTESQIGQFAAPYISNMINEANIIGIGLGTSVMKTIDNLKSIKFKDSSDKKVVQIMGGLTNNITAGTHSSELVKKLSEILSCEYYYINCPAVVKNAKLKESLFKEEVIVRSAKLWDKLDLAIMGVGVADCRSSLFKLFSPEMIKEAESSEACGQMNINFYDYWGKSIPLLENNKITIPINKLKKIRNKVVIGYGDYKIKAILGALRGALIDVLITDSLTIDAMKKDLETEN
jgi:deoxyribonucleoside regulator